MTTKRSGSPSRVQRTAHLMWVPVSRIKVPPHAQRELRQHRVDAICANLDLEQIGAPTVSKRGDWFHVLDGQHRLAALKQAGFDGDGYQLQCWCYEGLSDDQEAEVFLKLNDTLTVDAMSKFRIGVSAGREVETDINRIVRAQGLRVSRDTIDGGIAAVGTLRRVYGRAGGPTLGRTLRIIRDAYGDPGLEAIVIDGLALVCQRYNGQLDDEHLVKRLATTRGGVSALLGKAEVLRKQTGNQKAHCVAAAAVEIANTGQRGAARLPDWWKGQQA